MASRTPPPARLSLICLPPPLSPAVSLGSHSAAYDFDLSPSRFQRDIVPVDLSSLTRASLAAATEAFQRAITDVFEPSRHERPWWGQGAGHATPDGAHAGSGRLAKLHGTAGDLRQVSAGARRRLERLGSWAFAAPVSVEESQRERARRTLGLFLQCLPRGEQLVLRAIANKAVSPLLHPDKQLDEAVLWVRRAGSCESAMLRMHKGQQPRTLVREASVFLGRNLGINPRPRVLKPKIRSYVRTLTDLYDLRVPYWESVECVRKVAIVGAAVFLGPGSLLQIGTMLLVSLGFTCFYVEQRPYDQWSASMLSQFCQIVFFLSLLSALMDMANEGAVSGSLAATEMGWILVWLTVAAVVLSAFRIFQVPPQGANPRSHTSDRALVGLPLDAL